MSLNTTSRLRGRHKRSNDRSRLTMMPTEKEAMVQPKAGARLWGWMTSAMADMAMETLLNAPLITCMARIITTAPEDMLVCRSGQTDDRVVLRGLSARLRPCTALGVVSKPVQTGNTGLPRHAGVEGGCSLVC